MASVGRKKLAEKPAPSHILESVISTDRLVLLVRRVVRKEKAVHTFTLTSVDLHWNTDRALDKNVRSFTLGLPGRKPTLVRRAKQVTQISGLKNRVIPLIPARVIF